jgi:hypothetical protein
VRPRRGGALDVPPRGLLRHRRPRVRVPPRAPRGLEGGRVRALPDRLERHDRARPPRRRDVQQSSRRREVRRAVPREALVLPRVRAGVRRVRALRLRRRREQLVDQGTRRRAVGDERGRRLPAVQRRFRRRREEKKTKPTLRTSSRWVSFDRRRTTRSSSARGRGRRKSTRSSWRRRV